MKNKFRSENYMKKCQITITLTEEQLERIEKAAEIEMRNISSFVRYAVETYMKEHSNNDN